MTDDIQEALSNAWQSLCSCAPSQRPVILDWINRLLDKANDERSS